MSLHDASFQDIKNHATLKLSSASFKHGPWSAEETQQLLTLVRVIGLNNMSSSV